MGKRKTAEELCIALAIAKDNAITARANFVNTFATNMGMLGQTEYDVFTIGGLPTLSIEAGEKAFQLSLDSWVAHKKANRQLGAAKAALLVRGRDLLRQKNRGIK